MSDRVRPKSYNISILLKPLSTVSVVRCLFLRFQHGFAMALALFQKLVYLQLQVAAQVVPKFACRACIDGARTKVIKLERMALEWPWHLLCADHAICRAPICCSPPHTQAARIASPHQPLLPVPRLPRRLCDHASSLATELAHLCL